MADYPPRTDADACRNRTTPTRNAGGVLLLVPDNAIRRLDALAKSGHAVSTDQVREVLALTRQQFQRMTDRPEFPARERVGLKIWVSPAEVLAFVHRWNALANGIALRDLAALLRTTFSTARRMVRAEGFPPPLGEVNGRDRWDAGAVTDWHRARFHGAKLPPEADVSKAPKPKHKPAAKGNRDGKAKGEKEKPRA